MSKRYFVSISVAGMIGIMSTWVTLEGYNKIEFDGQIVFMTWEEQITIIHGKTAKLSQLTNNGRNYWPKWSPDGKRILFASIRDDHKNREIYLMDSDGKNMRRLTYTKGGNASDPRWGNNGTIYYQCAIKGKVQENKINLVTGETEIVCSSGEVSGKTIKERLELRKRIYGIFPSPDGKHQILYFGYGKRLELLEMATGARRELDAINPGQPSWSKDSKRFAYVSGSIPELDLRIFHLKENKYEEIKLPGGPDTGCGGELSWNVSSTRIVFSCGTPYAEKPDSWLYILDLKTKKSLKLIKGSSPDWH